MTRQSFALSTIFVLCGAFIYLNVQAMRVAPVLPADITLNLPAQSTPDGFVVSGGIYSTPMGVTIDNLPSRAYCQPDDRQIYYTTKFTFQCIWDTPNDTLKYAMAQIAIPVAFTKDMSKWDFDPDTLTLKPVVNDDRFLGNIIIIFLLCVVMFIILMNSGESERPKKV